MLHEGYRRDQLGVASPADVRRLHVVPVFDSRLLVELLELVQEREEIVLQDRIFPDVGTIGSPPFLAEGDFLLTELRGVVQQLAEALEEGEAFLHKRNRKHVHDLFV